MYIKCWGARGSISVSGEKFLKYGGDTTCLEIRSKNNEIIIVDAGTGIRRLGNRLIQENIYSYNMLFTHAHWDHLMGFPFFKPIFFSKTSLNIIRCPHPGKYAEKMMTRVMSPPYFPIKYEKIKANISYSKGCPKGFMIDSIYIEPINLSHPDSGCGYKFIEDGKTFVFLTDNELGFIHPDGHTIEEYADFCKGADLLFHDCEYSDEDYSKRKEWGHSSISQVTKLAELSNVKRLGIFHHNQDKSDKDVDDLVLKVACNLEKTETEVFGVCSDMEIIL